MSPILIVWAKEMLDTLRDRRTLWAMIIAPVLVMPLFIILPQKLLTRQMDEQERVVIKVAVKGVQNAPSLVQFLRSQPDLEVAETGDPALAVREEQATVGLAIPSGFESAMEREEPTVITVLSDLSKVTAGVQTARVQRLLETYRQSVVAGRLAAQGVDVGLLTPFEVREENTASSQQMGGAFLGMMLPMFIVLWGLVGGMYTAIDVTAGEKERLTLEPLLASPAGRSQLVLGKLLAVMTTSLAALILAVGSMLAAFVLSPPEFGAEGAAIAYSVPAGTALMILLAAVPVALMFGALEMAVCVFARSFKEAQNYIVPLQFVVLLPAIFVLVTPDLAPPTGAYAIPIFGALVTLRDLFLGQASVANFVIMLISSVIFAAIGVLAAIYQFRQERVLFRM